MEAPCRGVHAADGPAKEARLRNATCAPDLPGT